MKFRVERLIKVEHLRRYVREVDHEAESGPLVDKITTDAVAPSETISAINYILEEGGGGGGGGLVSRSVSIEAPTEEALESGFGQGPGKCYPHGK